eukprot:TRINITY_DN12903_c0_g2_i1.p1 TRINITY_DN12903_c0_g2~~TRINITY_DN12903_c0_g2_i1.p1  ORF type:complete len:710 (+),score=219.62 TRINITY_DN12903_c0_g2_i1:316-2130(+)
MATQTDSVETNTALVERLRLEMRKITQEVAENKNALDTGKAIRMKQREKFAEREKDQMEKIDAVGKAELAIGSPSANATGLVQVSRADVGTAMDQLKKIYNENFDRIRAWTSRGDRMELEDLMQDPSRFIRQSSSASPGFLQRGEATPAASSTADTVDGLLKAMREDFEKDLKQLQDEDVSNEKSYQELVSFKSKEIAVAIEQNETKGEQKATAADAVISGKDDIKAATASKANAEAYLKTVLAKCSDFRAEYQERTKTRAEEFQAVVKAIKVLDGEEAHALLKRSPSFLQTASSDSRAARASQALASAGKRLGAQALTTLARDASYGQFDKVRKAIEDLEKGLKNENTDEIKQNDECIKDLKENQLSDEDKKRVKEHLGEKITELQADIATVKKEMKTLTGDVDELNKQIKAAGENRDKEVREFKGVAADQQDAQRLLKKAIQVLKDVYSKQGEASFVQVQEHVQVVQPPAGFKPYKKSDGGSGVLVLLGQILEDSKRMEAQAKQAEEDSEKAFAELAGETQAEINSKTKEIAVKAGAKSGLEEDLAEAKKSSRITEDEISSIAKVNSALHEECDSLMKNFDLRMKARKEELQALAEAKAILS